MSCGKTETHGHGETSICGKPFYNGIHICTECKLEKVTTQRDELLAALKDYRHLYFNAPKMSQTKEGVNEGHRIIVDADAVIAKCEAAK